MNEPSKQPEVSHETAEDLNLLATKAFHQLLEADKTLLPAWKNAALKLSENEVPQDTSALKMLLEGGGDVDPKTA
jgi:hypothetical protein